ncbi:MAG: hypothetical protein WCK78_13010 [Paludibacter sp.]
MTAQIRDKIFFNGEMLSLASEPLEFWLNTNKTDKIRRSVYGSCWRGYVAIWKIVDNKLYLIGIDSNPLDFQKIKSKYKRVESENLMETVFPQQSEVFASWFNGVLKIQKGELIEYVHMGYESVYETEICIQFANGVIIEEMT